MMSAVSGFGEMQTFLRISAGLNLREAGWHGYGEGLQWATAEVTMQCNRPVRTRRENKVFCEVELPDGGKTM